jgi:hypothetical protein
VGIPQLITVSTPFSEFLSVFESTDDEQQLVNSIDISSE